MTVASLIAHAEAKLLEAGIASARVDAEFIVAHVLKTSRSGLYLESGSHIPQAKVLKVDGMVEERAKRVPLQLVLGSCEFMGLEFKVMHGVFIPRPETEILVGFTVDAIRSLCTSTPRILDIGTGAGTIAVSLAHLLKGCNLVATDISSVAVRLAKQNAMINKVDHLISFVVGEGLEFLKPRSEYFDVVVCNPPYVRTEDIALLEPEVRDYDPRIAIDGGRDGLSFFERIVPDVSSQVRRGGLVSFEIGFDQANQVKILLEANGFGEISVFKDLAGRDRVVVGKRI